MTEDLVKTEKLIKEKIKFKKLLLIKKCQKYL